MKAIHSSLMALAASLLLAPAVFAQTDTPVQYQHEKYDLQNGVGFNKYLVSTTPNENSEYTLRLETFVTGGVKATAIPTDFVLVLDNSGSMYYDYRPGNASMPNRIPFDNKTLLPFFVNDYGASDVSMNNYTPYAGATYTTIVTTATVGTRFNSSTDYKYFYNVFENGNVTRYYKYEDETKPSNNGYYNITRNNSNGYYNLLITLADGTKKYLYGDSIQDEPNTSITRTDVVIYNGTNMYHIKSRQEALLDGVKSFLDLIAEENAKDQWDDNVTKHQVAVVSFSSGYVGDAASITEYGGHGDKTRVIKSFTEVGSANEMYQVVTDRMTFRGPQTPIHMGVHLAKMLFEDLQTKDDGKYAALNGSGGPNRNKVAVVFTDGEPYYPGMNFFQITNPSVKDAKVIKEVGKDKINGRVYSIDLCMSTSSKDFLSHLSSNYPKGDCSATSGGYSANKFNGKIIPLAESDVTDEEWKYLKKETDPHYYKDSNDGDMSSVFSAIASGNTGQQAGEKLVVMDVMSDSFEMPANVSGKVKFYTAQCIGEKEIDGKKYLAFAKEIPVEDRPPLEHLWVSRTDEEGEETWVDIAQEPDGYNDVDAGITYKKTNTGKSITVSGFEFVDLWCGKDEVAAHNNTRQLDADDPNAEYAADGYRGFKLIIEFPIIVSEGALGGTGVPTNNEIQSGFYHGADDGTAEGNPIINYQKPALTIPVQLAVKKTGLKPGESASFTIQRRKIAEGSEWKDYTTFVLTSTYENTEPVQKLLNLNPDYYYRVKEDGWSFAYSNRAQQEATFPTTEPDENGKVISNPIVIVNEPIPTPKHAEAVVRNELKNY